MNMKKMFKVLLFPIWLVLEIVVFVLKLVMVLSSTLAGMTLEPGLLDVWSGLWSDGNWAVVLRIVLDD